MSTATSRRDTLAVLAGFLAVPALPAMAATECRPDTAILALGSELATLLDRSESLERDCTAAEELVAEMTGPVPRKPRDAAFFPRFADYQAAMHRYEADVRRRFERIAQVEERIGYDAIEEAANTAFAETVEWRERLAEMRATSLDGLIAKARIAERTGCGNLSKSIVADLIAMGDEA